MSQAIQIVRGQRPQAVRERANDRPVTVAEFIDPVRKSLQEANIDGARRRSQDVGVLSCGDLMAYVREIQGISPETRSAIIRSLTHNHGKVLDLMATTVQCLSNNTAFRGRYEPEISQFLKLATGFMQDFKVMKEAQGSFQDAIRRDSLTRLLTGTAFREEVEYFIATDEQSRGCAMGYIDLGKFKKVNDRWGHEVGSRVLKEVAEVIRENVRVSDGSPDAARMGGDEFAFFLSSVDRNATEAVGERLQKAVSSRDWSSFGLPSKVVRADIGIVLHPLGPVTERAVQAKQTTRALIHRADELMYRCKEGKMKVQVDVL